MYIYLPHKKLYTKLTYHDHFDKNVEQLDLKITRMSNEGVALFCGCATQFYFVIVYVDKVDCICWLVIDIIHLLGMCFDTTQEVGSFLVAPLLVWRVVLSGQTLRELGRDWGCYRLTQLHYLIWCLCTLILLFFSFFLPFPHFVFLCVFLMFILLDRAILYSSRFIKVETLKEKLLRNNNETY